MKNEWKEFIGEHLLSKKCDLPNKSKLHIVQLHAVIMSNYIVFNSVKLYPPDCSQILCFKM